MWEEGSEKAMGQRTDVDEIMQKPTNASLMKGITFQTLKLTAFLLWRQVTTTFWTISLSDNIVGIKSQRKG